MGAVQQPVTLKLLPLLLERVGVKRIKDMDLTTNARNLRIHQTNVEKLLWQHLRNRQMLDQKFRRQFPIDTYIVDFVCLELKLIVELDGGQHAEQIEYDQQRTKQLQKRGFKIIRFWNKDVLQNTTGVLEAIRMAILNSTNNETPSPPGRR